MEGTEAGMFKTCHNSPNMRFINSLNKTSDSCFHSLITIGNQELSLQLSETE